jgi:hypothetical protein
MGLPLILHLFYIGGDIVTVALQVPVYGGVSIGVTDINGFTISVGLYFYAGDIALIHGIHLMSRGTLCFYIDT